MLRPLSQEYGFWTKKSAFLGQTLYMIKIQSYSQYL